MPTAPLRDCAFANADCTEITAIKADDGRRVIFPTAGIHSRHVAARGLPVAPFSAAVESAIACDPPARLRLGISTGAIGAGAISGLGTWAV